MTAYVSLSFGPIHTSLLVDLLSVYHFCIILFLTNSI